MTSHLTIKAKCQKPSRQQVIEEKSPSEDLKQLFCRNSKSFKKTKKQVEIILVVSP